MNLSEFKNKKIAIVGLGTNNKKLAEYLTANNIAFQVINGWKNPDELIGKLDNFDVIFRTPGLPYLSKAIQQAKAKGVEISSQTKLFFELCPVPIIGVTGTKGKGTTSSLIAKILEASGKKVWLGGNIGRDPFEFLDQIKKDNTVVLELSSFQLQDLTHSPHIAVVLGITSDHLNHHASVDEYVKAKSSILEFQSENDFAIIHPSLLDWFKNLGNGKKIFFSPENASGFATKLLGEHNWENISAAVEVVKLLGIDTETIKKAVANFEALPHRLKILRTINGITFVDDGFSTNIDPAIAAIGAMSQPTILAIGGFDKGLDFKPLGQAIKQSTKIKGLIVFGQVTDKILESVRGFGGKIIAESKNMNEIIDQALSIATDGDTVLFSPATSSFDMFKNETDRAEQFVKAVNKL